MGVLLPLAIAGGLVYGCSSDRPDGATPGSALPPPSGDESCVAGQTRPCHALISITNGVKSCFAGVQTCGANTRWEACGAGEGTIEATNVGLGVADMIDPTEQDIKIRTHIAFGLADAAACANPCNPGCLGYDEDAGALTVDASQLLDAKVPNALVPPGQRSDVYHDKTYWGSDCEKWNTGNAGTGQASAACHGDTYCVKHNGSTNERECVPFQDGETQNAKATTSSNAISCRDPRPDVTIGLPCQATSPSSYIAVPVCNRGTAPIAAGQTITVSVGNSSLLPGQHTPRPAADAGTADAGSGMAACYLGANDCSITLTAPLNPGSCIRFADTVNCLSTLNGTKTLYANANRSIQECTFKSHITTDNPSTHSSDGEQVDQYGCQNNWATFNASQAPACPIIAVPKTVIFNYAGTCLPGQKVKWGTLAWNASTPGLSAGDRSDIKFEVATAPKLVDGGTGPYSAYVQIADARWPYNVSNSADPAICNMNATCSPAGCNPALCPRPFGAILGAPADTNEQLRLRVTLTPSNANLPVLFSYFLNYTCVDVE